MAEPLSLVEPGQTYKPVSTTQHVTKGVLDETGHTSNPQRHRLAGVVKFNQSSRRSLTTRCC